MADFYMKLYRREAGSLVAVCDKNVVGKTLKDGDVEVTISTHFYQGEEVTATTVLAALNNAFAGNFFGKKAVALAKKAGLIDKSSVKIIAKIPHAQFIRMTL